jgi:hypothetical protein
MSIWMILTFALCMLSGVLASEASDEWRHVAILTLAATLVVFLVGTVRRGIRRPVV